MVLSMGKCPEKIRIPQKNTETIAGKKIVKKDFLENTGTISAGRIKIGTKRCCDFFLFLNHNKNKREKLPIYTRINSSPASTEPIKALTKDNNAKITITSDIKEAVSNSDAIYTDVWVSMGDEAEEAKRQKDLSPYQVNKELMSYANPDAIFMHCLPAIRGEEVTSEVIDGPQSVIYDEAENRLHAQKAVLYHFLG